MPTPLAEPVHPDADKRINWSKDKTDRVSPSPEELLAQARLYDPAITLDELAGARLAASELGSGSFTELAAIVDAELNRAERAGMSLFESLTRGRGFGPQVAPRPASTRLDPRMRHLLAAREVLSGRARGISRGAVRFFDPKALERQHRAYRAWLERGRTGKAPRAKPSCNALELLDVWSFDYPKRHKRANRCPPDRSRTGSNTQAWIGEIPGIDATELMLMKPMPLGLEHVQRYLAARKLLIKSLGK